MSAELPSQGIIERLANLEAAAQRREDRLLILERAGFDHRVASIERELDSIRKTLGDLTAATHETLELVREMRLEEANREVGLLRDLLRVALTAGAGGGAIGTGVYAVLEMLGSAG